MMVHANLRIAFFYPSDVRFLTLAFFFFSIVANCQTEIPIRQWRMHLSYNSIHAVTASAEKIFGASESGIVAFDKSDNSLSTYTKLNGLSGTGITFIHFDKSTEQLVVAYEDGNLDIIRENEVTNFDRLKTSTLITGSKRINHISSKNGLAYLSSDFGVVVFDLVKIELKETWRDISSTGAPLRILSSAFLADSIFLSTDAGIQAGNINNNLLFFNNWKRFETGIFTNDVAGVASLDNRVYTAVNGAGIYRYENGSWTQEAFLTNENFTFLSSGENNLFIGQLNALWKFSTGSPTQIISDKLSTAQHATDDAQQEIWIGDQQNGLVTDQTGTFTNLLVNGPSSNSHFRLTYADNKLFSVGGGFTSGGAPLENTQDLNSFSEGVWTVIPKSFNDLTDLEQFDSKTFISSFGDGIEQTDGAGNSSVLNETNSPLQRATSPDGVFVTAMKSGSGGIWVANYRSSQPLHFLKNDNTWESFSINSFSARYAIDLETDLFNNVWMVVNSAQGGGLVVFDKDENSDIYLSEAPGSGGLPSRNVNAIAVDRDGNIWAGTDDGVAYFYDYNEDAVKPIFENRFLLKDEKITTIEVDGGNRKWIGTEKGVWLFGPTGEDLVYNFTEENSPLLSDVIRDIAINSKTGEVFFATDKGIVSYRADATAGDNLFKSVKIFPNPVTGNFSGTVGISGLATDAIVKITDVSGKLIWETQASGGTATWNVRDYNGKRASTGMYLVFTSTTDGTKSVVGKIVVVE